MSTKKLDHQNKQAIFQLMAATRPQRQKLISENKGLSGTDIIVQFPKFQDYNGELVNNSLLFISDILLINNYFQIIKEFQYLHPECYNNFVNKFETEYSGKILLYAKNEDPDLLEKLNQLNDCKHLCLYPH